MSIGITEITNETVKPAVPPMEVGGKDLSSESKVTEISAEPVAQSAPVEELKETTTMVGNNNETVELEKIPGVKEVRVIPSEANKRPAAFMGPDGKPLDFNMQEFIKETMNGGMINRLVKRYDLEGIDLEKEAALIEQKKSSLSASKRKAVIALLNMRNQQKQLLADIGKELMHKDNPSDEDLRRLLDSVEDATTNTEEAANAVANEIVRKAMESANTPAEEIPAPVEEAMEAAKVEYTPGEGGNDEVTTKALHDAVKNHGRTKFRGVFDSLDLVDDPQVGDVVHTIVPDDKGNHSGEELVYTYLGPNHWKLEGSYIQEELPGPVPEEPAKSDDGSIPLTIGE